MSYEIETHKEGNVLHVTVRGTRTKEAVVRLSAEVMEACRREQTPRVLIDVRQLGGRLDMLESFEIPTVTFPEIRDPSVLEKAVVVDLPEFESSFRFFESVARNRGFNFRIFGDPDAARTWLLQDEE